MAGKFLVIDGGSGGPGDPTMEQRVARLEQDSKVLSGALEKINERLIAIDVELKHLPRSAEIAALKADVARIDGKLAALPSSWQLLTMIISTWAAGAAIVFAILRFGGK